MARQNYTFHSISNGYITIYAFQFQCSKCICITTAFKRTNSEAHTYNNKMHERLSCTSLRFLYFSIKHARPPISSHFFLFFWSKCSDIMSKTWTHDSHFIESIPCTSIFVPVKDVMHMYLILYTNSLPTADTCTLSNCTSLSVFLSQG